MKNDDHDQDSQERLATHMVMVCKHSVLAKLGCTPTGACNNAPFLLRRVLRRALEGAFEKVLRRVLRRCLIVGLHGKKGSKKGSKKGF